MDSQYNDAYYTPHDNIQGAYGTIRDITSVPVSKNCYFDIKIESYVYQEYVESFDGNIYVHEIEGSESTGSEAEYNVFASQLPDRFVYFPYAEKFQQGWLDN